MNAARSSNRHAGVGGVGRCLHLVRCLRSESSGSPVCSAQYFGLVIDPTADANKASEVALKTTSERVFEVVRFTGHGDSFYFVQQVVDGLQPTVDWLSTSSRHPHHTACRCNPHDCARRFDTAEHRAGRATGGRSGRFDPLHGRSKLSGSAPVTPRQTLLLDGDADKVRCPATPRKLTHSPPRRAPVGAGQADRDSDPFVHYPCPRQKMRSGGADR